MTLTSLIEQTIIGDLMKDSRIAAFPPRPHDYPAAKSGDDTLGSGSQPQQMTISVTCTEAGDAFFGAGGAVQNINVEVELRMAKSQDPTDGNIIDEVESALSARLQPSYTVLNPSSTQPNRELAFSSSRHTVLGIINKGVSRRDYGLERVRVVQRTFIALLLVSI